jgi:hypothetical protein
MSERASKRPRAERVTTPTLVLTDRDFELLTLTGLCRYVSSEQLARTFFPSPDRCRRRLRALFDARLLSITLLSSTRPNLVSLTRAGLAAVAARSPDIVSRLRLAGPIRMATVEHHLGTVDMRLYAVALSERLAVPLLRWGGPQGELARERGLKQFSLEPDGLAEFDLASQQAILAQEFDTGAETLTVLRAKLSRYASALQNSRVHGLVIAAKGQDSRLRSIERLVTEAGLGASAAVLAAEVLRQRPALLHPRLLELLRSPNTAAGEAAFSQPFLGVPTPKPDSDRPAHRGVDRRV